MSIDISCNYGLGNLFLNPYSDSSGIMTFSSSNPSVASFENEISNNLIINNTGITTINIHQNTSNYYVANDVSFKLQVLPSIDYRLSLNLPSYVQYIDTSLNLSSYTTTGNSPGQITYSIINQKAFNIDTSNIASIDSNNIITFRNYGRMNIQILQQSSGNYSQQIIVSPDIIIPPKAFINVLFGNIQYIDTSLNLNNVITHNNPTSVIKYQLDATSINGNLASIDSNNIISFKNTGNIQINAKIDACMNNIELYSANNTNINVGIYGKANIKFISDISRQYIGNSYTLNSSPNGNPDISTNNINGTINYTVYDYNIYTNTQLDTSNNATINSRTNKITFKLSGTVILIATIPTSGIYYTCSTSQLITIYPEATISFAYPFTSPYGYFDNTGFRISNYITSTNSSGAIVYDISSTNNSIVLNNRISGDVSFTNVSTIQDGTGTIQIYQSASGSYSSKTIRQSITIYKRSNISFLSKLANQIYNNNLYLSLNQYITSSSIGSLLFSLSDPNRISILTNPTTTGDLSINNIGNLSLYVHQDASGIYSANDTSIDVIVSPGNVLFSNSGQIIIKYGTIGYNPNINAIDASSGLPVSEGNTVYTSYNTIVDQIDPNTGTITTNNVGTDIINITHSNTNKYYDNSINILLSIIKADTPLSSSFNFTDFSNNLNNIFYVYGKTIPIINPTTTLSGSSDFKYSYSTTSLDISINKISDNCFNILVINARQDIPLNVLLISSSNYNTGSIYNTKMTINKHVIIQPSSFKFDYHDVSYTGGRYIIPAPYYNSGYDFSYTYQALTPNINVSSASDGNCVVIESSGNNTIGMAQIRAIQGTSNNYVIGTYISLSYTINKGNSLSIPLYDISWTPIPTQTYSYNGMFVLPKPVILSNGASDMSFSFSTTSTAITITNNIRIQSYATMKNATTNTPITISANLIASSNYDIIKPLSFNLNPFTINKSNPPIAILTLINPNVGDNNYNFNPPTFINQPSDYNPSITYSSSNTAVGRFDNSSNPSITLLQPGSIIMTAHMYENTNYLAMDISNQINVITNGPIFSIENITSTSIGISIKQPYYGSDGTYNNINGFYYSTTTDTLSSYSSLINNNSFTINGLTPYTTYNIYVKTNTVNGNTFASSTSIKTYPFNITGSNKVVRKTNNNYTIIFNDSGTIQFTKPGTINYLIVGGGGGGGSNNNRAGGGGGAGGYKIISSYSITASSTVYNITVGQGGTTYNPGTNGGDSYAFGYGVSGGGGGGTNQNAKIGGSGGGDYNSNGASGITGQGNKGGNSYNTLSDSYNNIISICGGGGGAGSSGIDASFNNSTSSIIVGSGGAGITITSNNLPLFDSSINVCGGGAGGFIIASSGYTKITNGIYTVSGGIGGLGGGGNSLDINKTISSRTQSNDLVSSTGSPNTGGGGSGATTIFDYTPNNGTSGGSGIVIITYSANP
jgi:hypothetical protein